MKVYPQHKAIVIPYRADVENALQPAAKRFEHAGQWYLALPHTLDVVRFLRNLGLKAPSPINSYYDYLGGTPFESQRETADMCSVSRRAYVLSEMGVGKTRAVLWAYDYLRREGQANKLLVVAPLSTLVTVWENELFEQFPHLTARVLYGDKRKRRKLLAEQADVYIINHDGVEVLHPELFGRSDIDTVIVDELASYRNSRSLRWKNLAPIVKRSQFAWGLTGSPTPNAPTDAFGQAKLLTPESVGYSFKAFKDRTMRQLGQFKWIERHDAIDTVHGVMQPAVRFTRAQCLDLPPTTYSTLSCALSKEATKAYKEMCDDLSTQIRSNEITAANQGVKLSKLLQISAGFAYDADGSGHYIGGVDRIREIIQTIEGASGKVIVFAPFRYFVELLGAVLAKKYDTAIVHGDVPASERTRIFSEFQKTSNIRVIVAHPACMAHGITLTAANTIIWASPPTSLEIYEQANARITRAGQGQNTFIVNIASTKVEQHVYNRLRKKAALQNALLDLFENGELTTGMFGAAQAA
jgi:SNF2 family DNA or RNA helicase